MLFKGTVAWNIFIPEFFKFGWEIWLKNPSFQNIGPWNLGMDFFVALITFSIDFLVALNTIAWVYLLL